VSPDGAGEPQLATGHDGAMSELSARIRSDLTAAMKARDEVTVSTLRLVISAISTASVAGESAVELSDDQVIDVLRSEAKRRAEAAEVYEGAGRSDRAESERAEFAVIERYLPAAIEEGELAAIVAEEVAQVVASGASGGRAMGECVKAVRARVGSGADGARVAAAVKAGLEL
jgi:uncharacterized protein YqeY